MFKIDVLEILRDLGISYKASGQYNVRIKCINENHVEKNPSMFVHIETGAFNCFGCGFRGNILSLFKAKGFTQEEAKKIIRKFVVGGSTESEVLKYLENFVENRLIKTSTGTIDNKIITPNYKPAIDSIYLKQRNISQEEANYWGMGIVNDVTDEFRMYLGWIFIPIYQENVLRNYFLRSQFGSGKRYGPYPRNDVIFGLDTASDKNKKIYLVEGIFDAISFRRTRNQCVAVLSNNLHTNQLQKLKDYKSIVVVPDNDSAGKELVKSAFKLIHNTEILVCRLPNNRKDAAECSLVELIESTYNEISANEYFTENKYGTNSGTVKQFIQSRV